MRRASALLRPSTACIKTLTQRHCQSATHAAPVTPHSGRWGGLTGAAAGVGLAGAVLVWRPTYDDLRAAYLTPVRLARDVYTAGAIVAGRSQSWPVPPDHPIAKPGPA